MRIIGGALAGRTLPGKPPDGTRPTADRVREAIASALQARGLFEDATVVDLYAGTGALGLEALSWGARRLVAIDASAAALRCIRVNAEALALTAQISALRLELGRGSVRDQAARIVKAAGEPITLLLADPPYAEISALTPVLEALVELGPSALAPFAGLLVEHAHKSAYPVPAGFVELARYRYGDTGVLLAAREPFA